MQILAIIILIVFFLTILMGGFDNDGAILATGIIVSVLLGVILSICVLSYNWPDRVNHTYQVRELERNTVFNITDSIGGYNSNDTVWVNMNKLTIDPTDSVAMMGVIIKEIK